MGIGTPFLSNTNSMWAAVRSRSHNFSLSSQSHLWQSWKLGVSGLDRTFSSSSTIVNKNTEILSLQEVEKILNDVRADNVTVIPTKNQCHFADFMVIATGRSPWHVRNIAQALVYKAKQKQKGAKQLVLPTVEGQEGGKWIVVDSGKVIVHALEEKARGYFDLEGLWTVRTSQDEGVQDLERALMKIRRKNKCKEPAESSCLS